MSTRQTLKSKSAIHTDNHTKPFILSHLKYTCVCTAKGKCIFLSIWSQLTHVCVCIGVSLLRNSQPSQVQLVCVQDKHVFLSVYLATTHMCLCVCGGGVCMGVYLLRNSQPSHEPK